MPNEYPKNQPSISRFSSCLNGNLFFVVFFILLVLRVLPGMHGNRMMGGVVWVLVLLFFIWGIFRRYGGPSKWPEPIGVWVQNNKLAAFFGALLVIGLFISCLNALVSMQEEFGWVWKNWQMPLALFASALASYIFLFLSYGLFRLYPGNRNYYWALALLLLVNIIPFWQKFDYDSTAFFLMHTVAAYVRADGVAFLTGRLHSVLRWITIYSPFAAVLAVFFWGRFLVKKSVGPCRYFELLVGIFCIGGALLPGSRTGIVSLFAGFVALIFYVSGRRKWWIVSSALIAIFVMHVFVLWNPYMGEKIGRFLPYVNKLRLQEPLKPRDFVPDFAGTYSSKAGNRLNRIKEAFTFWRENPWFGIGLGQYNVNSGHHWPGNVHNLFLNILCEAGIFVFVAWLYLAGRFVWRFRRSYLVAVVVTIFVVSCFENLFDHSLPWVLTCAWVFSRDEMCVS